MEKEPLWLLFIPGPLREKIAGRKVLHAILSNSSWLLFDKFIRLLLGLFIGAWVARYLGPSRYGELAYAVAFIAFFQAVTYLGMDGLVVRDIAKIRSNSGQIIGTSFSLRLITGVFCWLFALAGTVLIKGWHDRAVILTTIVGVSLLVQAADTIDLWFQSQSQSRRTVIAKLTAYILSNSIKVVLILSNASLVFFAAVLTLDAVLAAIGLFIAHRFFPAEGKWRFSYTLGLKLLKESWPYMLSSLSIIVYMRIDQIMINSMIGDKPLGMYAAAMPLSQIWHIIPMTLSISFAPVIARKKKENNELYEKALLKIFRVFILIALFVTTGTVITSPLIVSLLYGKAYSGTATVLMIHVFTNIFIFQGVAQSLWLVNEKKGHLALYKTVLGSITAVLCNFLLIPEYGILGAALSAVIAQAVSAFLSNIVFAPRIFLMQIGIKPPSLIRL